MMSVKLAWASPIRRCLDGRSTANRALRNWGVFQILKALVLLEEIRLALIQLASVEEIRASSF